MSSFLVEYKKSGNSVDAYLKVINCKGKSLQEISDGSLEFLEDVFEDVDFYVSSSTNRGVLKNIGKTLGGIVSLGGSYMLEMHNKHYSDIYHATYKPLRYKIESIEKETNRYLALIGDELTKLNEVLRQVEKAIKRSVTSSSASKKSLIKLNKFNSGFSTSMNAGFGGLIGGTTALGAWGLVSLVGSASTGTAISSLSGVAATNATLAWFGGGSLATGGAGMAGGFWVLGGIVAAPIVFFSTKNAYKKVDLIIEKKKELISESEKITNIIDTALEQLEEAKSKYQYLRELIGIIIPAMERELRLYNQSSSFWSDLFGREMNEEQARHYHHLNKLTNGILAKIGVD